MPLLNGRFRPLPLPDSSVATMPPSVRRAFEKMTGLLAQQSAAAAEATQAAVRAEAAPQADRAAAVEATKQGRPLPPETAPALRVEAREAQRRAEALLDLVVASEGEFLVAAEVNRAEWAEAALVPARESIEDARVALTALAERVGTAADLAGVWVWLTYSQDLTRPPKSRNVSLSDVSAFLAEIDPEAHQRRVADREAKEKADAEEARRSRGGIVLDTSLRR